MQTKAELEALKLKQTADDNYQALSGAIRRFK